MAVFAIDIGKQSRSVLRVLEEFHRQTSAALTAHGPLDLYQDGLPLVVISIRALYPTMRSARRFELAAQVFDIIDKMHTLALTDPPTATRQ